MKAKIKKILALVIAGVALVGASIAVVSCHTNKQNEATMYQAKTDNPMVLGVKENYGISLTSMILASADYTDYGVSPTAESAYTLTATVSPPSAGNQALDWSVEWVNPNSSWASGKTATDYVTVVPATSGGKTATVSCVQAFGEQIKVIVKARENKEKYATCLVDYAQKVEAASLNFGDVEIKLGGKTAIKYEVAEGVQGPGGEVYADLVTSSVYTLADTFSYSVQISEYAEYIGTGNYFSLKGSAITGAGNFSINTEYYGEEVYFDYDHDICDWMIIQRTGDILFEDFTTEEIISYLSDITKPGLYQVNFTLTGTYNTYTYTSQVYCNGYTNNTPVNAVALDAPGYVF